MLIFANKGRGGNLGCLRKVEKNMNLKEVSKNVFKVKHFVFVVKKKRT